jgi:predicted Zn-dependent protease with MMP-like domain
MVRPNHRRQFDQILDRLVEELPAHIHHVIEEIPVIVDDEPDDDLLDEMGLDPSTSELCGLHWGIPLTRRSVEHSGVLPDQIHLFRGPIIRLASRGRRGPTLGNLERQIRITLLHEIGHHFGLDEADLAQLGYG